MTLLLSQYGYLPDKLRDLVANRLLVPSQMKLVEGRLSDFSYKHIIPPAQPITLHMSPQHVELNIERFKSYLKEAGLSNRFSEQEIREVGLQSALIHEYGHAMDTGLNILLAADVIHSQPPFAELSVKPLDPTVEQYIWDLVGQRNKARLLLPGDNRLAVLGKYFNEYEIITSLIEGFSTGTELALIDSVARQKGLNQEEILALFKSIHIQFDRRSADYLYYTRLSQAQFPNDDKRYLLGEQHNTFLSAITWSARSRGYYLVDELPSSPNGKIIGYNLPLFPDAYRAFIKS